MKKLYEITLTNFKNGNVISAQVDYIDMEYICSEFEYVNTINNKIITKQENEYLIIIDERDSKRIYIPYQFLKDCILITKKN